MVPSSMQDKIIPITLPIDIKKFANRVVHPNTNKKITKYNKLIEVLTFQKVSMAESYVH